MGMVIKSDFKLVQRPLVMPVCWELGKGHIMSLSLEVISESTILVQRAKTKNCHFRINIGPVNYEFSISITHFFFFMILSSESPTELLGVKCLLRCKDRGLSCLSTILLSVFSLKVEVILKHPSLSIKKVIEA